MILSNRKISEELEFYRVMNFRTKLSVQEEKKLSVLERGYAGECIYDQVFDEVGHDSVFIFRDIYLKIEDSITQYDALIISNNGIVVNEVKNFSGDYRYEDGKWFYGQFQVPEDAIAQLKRSVGKLIRVKYNMTIDFEVGGKIVFPHVEFNLNSNDRDLWNTVIMRSNLRRYLKTFQGEHASARAEKIAEEISKRIVPNPYFDKSAEFETVKKGFYCGTCGSFELEKGRFHFKCQGCECKETIRTHLVRSISDYKILFRNKKLTKKDFMEFIDNMVCSRTALRVLSKYCTRSGAGTNIYYNFNYNGLEEFMENHDSEWRYRDYMGGNKY